MSNLYLVDDDQDVLDSLSWMLNGLGYQPQGFLSADDFLKSVDLQQSAIAILDVQMPGMDGSALLSHMVQANSPIAVIMLSGHGNIAMAVQAIQKGALDFLEKPVDGDKLAILLALVGGFAASISIIAGMGMLWIRKPMLQKILTNA